VASARTVSLAAKPVDPSMMKPRSISIHLNLYPSTFGDHLVFNLSAERSILCLLLMQVPPTNMMLTLQTSPMPPLFLHSTFSMLKQNLCWVVKSDVYEQTMHIDQMLGRSIANIITFSMNSLRHTHLCKMV